MTTREEIDGTIKGAAALVAVRLDASEPPLVDYFYEGLLGDNPIQDAHDLKEGVWGDFPDRVFGVVANERAKYLRWRVIMQSVLGPDEGTIEDYLECDS